MFIQAAWGLMPRTMRGLVHGDLKAQNAMVGKDGAAASWTSVSRGDLRVRGIPDGRAPTRRDDGYRRCPARLRSQRRSWPTESTPARSAHRDSRSKLEPRPAARKSSLYDGRGPVSKKLDRPAEARAPLRSS